MALAFCVSAIFAGVMGFAIQRGATCTVAAVDELVTRRRVTRLVSLVEASAWVVAGLLLARALGIPRTMPGGYPVGIATVTGGALLGFGAYVNRACVFGAIARLGSGEWAYIATPLGFYVGCLSVSQLPFAPAAEGARGSPILDGPAWLALLAAAFVVLRAGHALFGASAGKHSSLREHVATTLRTRIWSPHAATCVIGVAFVVILLLSGAWAYTDVLAELAHGMASSLPARIGLLAALFAGAVAGGVTAGRFRVTRVTTGALLRCLAGGVLMGWGSLLIPGSNDGLILVGMPLLLPHAWIAFLTMCVVIAVAMLAGRLLARVAGPVGASMPISRTAK
jgi:toxin CptA